MTRNNDRSLSAAIPIENLNEFFPEFSDLNYEELLQHQESLYESLRNNRNNDRRHGAQSTDWSQLSGLEGESSQHGSFGLQLALDEAMAMALQLEDDSDDLDMSQSTSTSTVENREPGSRGTPVMRVAVMEDPIDPDNMTYEQLQELGESIGSETKGLSEDLISRLPNFKYKTSILSKKKEKQECVICYKIYKNGDKLTALPCAHQYHLKCVTPWLRLNKHCPICQVEVSADLTE
ncbi:E3 ubiquitin ligase BIG BROTHER-related-like isoform X1 [Diospyros lotus]|uniref:E3 ubiquitin ligase BIG BROTHER-related-like isoform X1 n=1 Tax=Diospyros lotus TaxID=55363 RepID=UPI00225AC006|nr:E3 ubiquitin ligase BIG BROTHER-related-like isoform X1 [Diospyros lotus]